MFDDQSVDYYVTLYRRLTVSDTYYVVNQIRPLSEAVVVCFAEDGV